MREQRTYPLEDFPPQSSIATAYDAEHATIYVRIMDAVAEGAEPSEIARIVLQIDPDKEPARALRVFRSHHARAVWMVEAGYRYLLSDD